MLFTPVYKIFSAFVRDYEWVHLAIGIIGNILFLTGSILFLNKADCAGWFFLAGTTGMLVNSIGGFIVRTEFKGKTALTQTGRDARKKGRGQNR